MQRFLNIMRGVALIWVIALGGCASDYSRINNLARQLTEADRWQQDAERDAGERSAIVMHGFGIKPDMQVLNLEAAGDAYYSEVLSITVGQGGVVYVQHPKGTVRSTGSSRSVGLEQRQQNGRLPNVVHLREPLEMLALDDNSLDVILLPYTLHNLVQTYDAKKLKALLGLFGKWLKKGGFIGILDYYGEAHEQNTQLERLNISEIVPILWPTSGFYFEQSVLSYNSEDKNNLYVLDPMIAGYVNRVIFKMTRQGRLRL